MSAATFGDFGRLNTRKIYPIFYYVVIILALVRVGLGLNFFFSRPTFMPYGIHKGWAGLVFLVSGVATFIILQWVRDIRWIRFNLAVSSALMTVWGLVNSQQWFHHKASLQLPIVFVGMGITQTILIIYGPRLMPLSEKK